MSFLAFFFVVLHPCVPVIRPDECRGGVEDACVHTPLCDGSLCVCVCVCAPQENNPKRRLRLSQVPVVY